MMKKTILLFLLETPEKGQVLGGLTHALNSIIEKFGCKVLACYISLWNFKENFFGSLQTE